MADAGGGSDDQGSAVVQVLRAGHFFVHETLLVSILSRDDEATRATITR
ncbi:hypothetical protein [Frondihabitans sp. PAMC 28766]|nr:hypothetical protein [Frondihabitans sp. PAMC 28766]